MPLQDLSNSAPRSHPRTSPFSSAITSTPPSRKRHALEPSFSFSVSSDGRASIYRRSGGGDGAVDKGGPPERAAAETGVGRTTRSAALLEGLATRLAAEPSGDATERSLVSMASDALSSEEDRDGPASTRVLEDHAISGSVEPAGATGTQGPPGDDMPSEEEEEGEAEPTRVRDPEEYAARQLLHAFTTASPSPVRKKKVRRDDPSSSATLGTGDEDDPFRLKRTTSALASQGCALVSRPASTYQGKGKSRRLPPPPYRSSPLSTIHSSSVPAETVTTSLSLPSPPPTNPNQADKIKVLLERAEFLPAGWLHVLDLLIVEGESALEGSTMGASRIAAKITWAEMEAEAAAAAEAASKMATPSAPGGTRRVSTTERNDLAAPRTLATLPPGREGGIDPSILLHWPTAAPSAPIVVSPHLQSLAVTTGECAANHLDSSINVRQAQAGPPVPLRQHKPWNGPLTWVHVTGREDDAAVVGTETARVIEGGKTKRRK